MQNTLYVPVQPRKLARIGLTALSHRRGLASLVTCFRCETLQARRFDVCGAMVVTLFGKNAVSGSRRERPA